MIYSGAITNCFSSNPPPPPPPPPNSGVDEPSVEVTRHDSSSATNSASTVNDAAQMDIYRDLILRHLIQDINTTCTKLGLPTGHL